MAKQTEAIQKNEGSQAIARPDWMESSNEGLENIGLRDMVIPRVGLCQTNTAARNRANVKDYIEGLQEGQFYNSLTGQIYGDRIRVVPLCFYKSRIMFKDLSAGGGIICQAPNGNDCQLNHGGPCIHAAWRDGKPPECTEFFNYPCMVYNGPGQLTHEWVVVSLKTTGMDAARTLNSLMRMRGGAPAYGGVYELTSVPDKNAANLSYFTWMAENAMAPNGKEPLFVDQELFGRAKELAQVTKEGLKAGTIQVQAADSSDSHFADSDSEV